eukprot:1161868-Pelagomonas_calceolata.AAC.14
MRFQVETAGDCYIVSGGIMKQAADGFNQVLEERHDPAESAHRVLGFAKAILDVASRQSRLHIPYMVGRPKPQNPKLCLPWLLREKCCLRGGNYNTARAESKGKTNLMAGHDKEGRKSRAQKQQRGSKEKLLYKFGNKEQHKAGANT